MPTVIQRGAAVLALVLVALSFGAALDPAHAQSVNVGVSKDLCGPAVLPSGGCVKAGGSVLPLVAPNTPVAYTVTLSNSDPTPVSVDLGDTFPLGFNQSGPTVSCTNNSAPVPVSAGFIGPVTVPAAGQTVCTIDGFFSYLPATGVYAGNKVQVYRAGDHTDPNPPFSEVNATVAAPSTIPSNVSVTKSAQVTASGYGTTTVIYTITVHNSGPNDIYGMQLQDRLTLPSTSLPLKATYHNGSGHCTATAGSTCYGNTPSTIHQGVMVLSTSPVDFLEWAYPPTGPRVLKAGGTITIVFTVTITLDTHINCVKDPLGNKLINEAHIGFNIPGATTTTFEAAPGNDTAYAPEVPVAFDGHGHTDPNCKKPALQVTKTLLTPTPPGGAFAWGTVLAYEITLHNNSSQPITNIQIGNSAHKLGDFVSGGIGTPAFEAQVGGISCQPTVCSAIDPPNAIGAPQAVTGYLHPHWMMGTVIVPALGSTDITFQIKVQYSKPECDSYMDVQHKPVINYVKVRYSDPTLGGDVTLQSPDSIAYFEAPPACNFKVTKSHVSGEPAKISFLNDVHYDVSFVNANNQPMTVGTMIDALRIVEADYAPLGIQFSFTCSSPNGVTGFPTSGGGTVLAVHTSLPQQGVRIIRNSLPVSFPPNGVVNCKVKISVSPPSFGEAKCARIGTLENVAIMDRSAFYDSNFPWGSTQAGYAAKVGLPLPQCIDLVVNKGSKVTWTTPNGGPIGYNLTLSNLGDPILAADHVMMRDQFLPPPPLAPSGATVDSCVGAGQSWMPPRPECDFAWGPPLSANPGTMNVSALAHQWSASTVFQVSGPFPAPNPTPQQVCNHAEARLSGIAAADWYARDERTWKTDLCIPIFNASKLTVAKAVVLEAPAVMPTQQTIFPVTVSCTYSFNSTPYNSTTTLNFTYPPTPIASQTTPNIPNGSTCTITETLPTDPIPNKGCPSGVAVWGPVQYSDEPYNPKGPKKALNVVASHGVTVNGPQTIQVLNTLKCAPKNGSIVINKEVINGTSASLAGWYYPVAVTCNGQQAPLLHMVAGQPLHLNNMAPNLRCHVEETGWQTLPLPEKACPQGMVPQWQPPTYTNQDPVTGNQPSVVTMHNELECVKSVAGSLTVVKTLAVPSWMTLPAGSIFPVNISCTSGYTNTVNLTAPGYAQPVTPPLGDDCTLSEQPSPNYVTSLPGGAALTCGWVTSYPNGVTAHITAGAHQLEVHNRLYCNVDFELAQLQAKKTTIVGGVAVDLAMSFAMEVDCGAGYQPAPALGPANQYQVTALFPVINTTQCKLREASVPPVPPGHGANCQWVTTYASYDNGTPVATPTTASANATISVPHHLYVMEVINTLVCNASPPIRVNQTPAPPPVARPQARQAPPAPVTKPVQPSACPTGTVLRDGGCVQQSAECQAPMVRDRAGACACPAGMSMKDGACVPDRQATTTPQATTPRFQFGLPNIFGGGGGRGESPRLPGGAGPQRAPGIK